MKTFKGKNFFVDTYYPLIKIIQGEKEKMICDTKERFDGDFIKLILPLQLKLDECLAHFSYHGRIKIVRYVIKQGANVNYNNDYPLIAACERGHFAVVKLLIKHGANKMSKNGEAVRFAGLCGHYNIVKFLEK